MRRILVVGDFMRGSGMTRYLMDTFGHLNMQKYQIDIMAFGGKTDMDEIILQKGWHINKVTPVTTNPLYFLLEWHHFLRARKNTYDLIHFNYSASWNYFPVIWARRYTNAKIVIHSHSSYFGSQTKHRLILSLLTKLHEHGKKVMSRKGDLLLAVSPAAAEWMFVDQPAVLKKLVVVSNGVDLARFTYNSEMRQFMRKKHDLVHKFVIGYAGMFLNRKNPLFVVDIFAAILKREPTAYLVMIGIGELQTAVKNRIQELGLERSVALVGLVGNIEDWYQAFDAFVLPSKKEGFGLVAIEAQASGVATFVSDALPKKVVATPVIQQIGLSKSKDEWAAIILQCSKHKRESQVNLLQAQGFSIDYKARELDSLYSRLLGE